MKVTKIFFTTNAEKKWLESKAKEGYELIKREGFSYILEKTDCDVRYLYVFLKNGRRSFVALDYKSKDREASAVYGNGYVALFKKVGNRPQILPFEQLKLNYLRHRQKRVTWYLCLIAVAVCCITVARTLAPMWLAAVFCLAVAALYFADANGVQKMVKDL